MPFFTLTSDIGHKDYLIGAVKGLIWRQHAAAQIADITHEITPFNYNEAAYFIANAYPHFPPFTWHVLLLNLFDQPSPRCLLAFHDGMYFAVPDNGLLPMVLNGMPDLAVELPLQSQQVSNMLDWVKEIAIAANKIEQGKPILEIGAEAENILVKTNLRANIGEDFIEGRVIFIDRFENVIVNITRDEFEKARKGRNFQIKFKGNDVIEKLVDHYGQVNEGDKLAFFNTSGYLEIAVNKGNAAGLFGLQALDARAGSQFHAARMFYQTVRIFFT